MAFSRLVFSILLLSASCYASDVPDVNVPAFLWGDLPITSSKANPLETITTPELRAILKDELIDDRFTVVFIDETLSVEDFSRKNGEGMTAFPYLHAQLSHSLYLPSVNNLLTALNEIAAHEDIDHVKLTENGISKQTDSQTALDNTPEDSDDVNLVDEEVPAEIGSKSCKFLVINLKDAKEGESRTDLLRRHNDFMQETYAKLQERHNNVIAIYTANYPSWVVSESHSRSRRQAENATETATEVLNLDGLRMYVKKIEIKDGNNTVTLDGSPAANTLFGNDSITMSTKLTFGDNSFIMNFHQKMGYWFLDSVTLGQGTANEDELKPSTEVYALSDFSYRCAQTISFNSVNISRSLVFENMRIQPYFKTTNESTTFGDTFDCVGFFSAPIWAGLMVTFILLSITFYGIMMMMDIRTMDRFDDPKGKTITINTME